MLGKVPGLALPQEAARTIRIAETGRPQEKRNTGFSEGISIFGGFLQ
jgi:hypothetical protein